MASYTAARSVHKTLAANTVDTVTLSNPAWVSIEVLNHDTAGAVYFTVDGSTPTVGGNDTYVALPYSATSVFDHSVTTESVVKLISTEPASYSVTGQGTAD